ncbi:MAG: type 4a pilus biogenesis protein PilO [Candidatus Omnitrophota bacterium]
MNLADLKLDQQKKIAIIVLLVLIAYVDSVYILKAQRSGLKGLNVKIAKLNKDLVNLNQGLENMRLVKVQPGTAALKKATRPSKILPEGRISEILQEISSAANRFDIRISQIRPSRPAQKEKSAIGQDKLTSLLINLDLVADYHSLGKFIQSLENSPVFMGVQELKISTQLPDYMKQKVTLVIKTYVTK